MADRDCFSEDYVTARGRFVAACRASGTEPQRWINPAPSLDTVELSTEIAWFGPRDADRLLILISGMHGVEALCGSACQTGLIETGAMERLPPSTATLMVHAINCWGAANLRRNNEDNVDPCRNFLDFGQPLPDNSRYEEIHEAVNCAEQQGPARQAAQHILAEYRRIHGLPGFIQALMGGQYRHADGFAYGGSQPVWSNRTINAVLAREARRARRVCIVEYHSGLGPYAYGTAVTMHTGEALERARRWFGHWIDAPLAPHAGQPLGGHVPRGHSTEGYLRALPEAEVTSIVLEFGTYPPTESLPVMLEDHWLTIHGDASSEAGRRIRRRLLALHHPSDPDWREAVWHRSQQVFRQALRGLAA